MDYDPDLLPAEINSEKKFSKHIYIKDFFIIMLFVVIGYVTKSRMVSFLQDIYWAGMGLLGFYLTRRPKDNPKKRMYEALWFYLTRPREGYEPISIENKGIEEDYAKFKEEITT